MGLLYHFISFNASISFYETVVLERANCYLWSKDKGRLFLIVMELQRNKIFIIILI